MTASSSRPCARCRLLTAVIAIGVFAAVLLLAGCAPEPRPTPAGPSEHSVQADPTPPETPAAETESSLLLASLAHTDAVAIVDPSQPDASAVQRITVGAAPWGVGVADDGATGYAATAEGLAVIDLDSRQRTALIPFQHSADRLGVGEYRAGGLGLAVSPNDAPGGARVYVAMTSGDGTYFLEVFDVATEQFIAAVPVGLRPFDVLVAPNGSWAATVDHDGFTVTVVDAQSLEATTHTVAPFGTEGGLASWEKPHYGAVAADGSVLLPYQGKVVVRLDPRTGRMSTIASAADSHAHGTALDGDLLLTVGTGSFGNATGSPNLSLLDVVSGEERIVPLDVPHETVAVWTAVDGTHFAAVAGGNTRNEGWDGITLVSVDTLDTRSLPVDGYPQAVVSYAHS